MSRAEATWLRVECGADGSVRVVGAGFERPISLAQLARLARALCQSRRGGGNLVQDVCRNQLDTESLDAE